MNALLTKKNDLGILNFSEEDRSRLNVVDNLQFSSLQVKQLSSHLSRLIDAFDKFVQNPLFIDIKESDNDVADFCDKNHYDIQLSLNQHYLFTLISARVIQSHENGSVCAPEEEIIMAFHDIAVIVKDTLAKLKKHILGLNLLKSHHLYSYYLSSSTMRVVKDDEAEDCLFAADTIINREINNLKSYCEQLIQ